MIGAFGYIGGFDYLANKVYLIGFELIAGSGGFDVEVVGFDMRLYYKSTDLEKWVC